SPCVSEVSKVPPHTVVPVIDSTAARSDFLTKQRRQIETRLKELRPAHEEYLALLEAKEALEGLKSVPNSGRAATRRGPGRPPAPRRRRRAATTPARPSNGRRRPRRPTSRRRSGATRADQALGLIKSNPGITVAQLA